MKVYDAHEDSKENYQVLSLGKHAWVIKGEKLEARAALINLSTDEGVEQLIKLLNSVNIDDKLKEAGAVDGDTVSIGEFDFTYTE